jgi:tetratricopeptide (TPR) repeat protein
MASLIQGFEYDIFISYRQKDNKHDSWVTNFVANLKNELDAISREDVSVYFDMNPHDGLLETYDISDSLDSKLRCIVFIPIISRTYCDPSSFAWKHEFRAFSELASKDQFGLKVKLHNGNVASRILPVRIYDLSSEEVESCEAVSGGVLRGIDFIFKSAGVNRPLRPDEDHPGDNLNKTYYLDQINKVANSVKEIIDACKYPGKTTILNQESPSKKPFVTKPARIKLLVSMLILLAFIITGILFGDKTLKHEREITLAVLPLKTLSGNHEHEDLNISFMQQILLQLSMIDGLKLPSITSSIRLRDSDLSSRDIARELDALYILEGRITESATDTGKILRVILNLLNGQDESVIWALPSGGTINAEDIFDLYAEVARQVAKKLNLEIDPSVNNRLNRPPTNKYEAYRLFLMARSDSLFPFKWEEGMKLLDRAILLDPDFADAYALKANYWIGTGTLYGQNTPEKVIDKVEPLLETALQLDDSSVIAHVTNAMLRLWFYRDFDKVAEEYNFVKKFINSDIFQMTFFTFYLISIGEYNEALDVSEKGLKLNKNSPIPWSVMILALYFNGQPERALEHMERTWEYFPDDQNFVLTHSIRLLIFLRKYDDAIKLFETHEKRIDNIVPFYLGHLGIAYYETNNEPKAMEFLSELLQKERKSPVGSPSYFAAGIYAAMGDNEKAIKTLQKGLENREVEMYWLKVDPLFADLHGDPAFKTILKRAGF